MLTLVTQRWRDRRGTYRPAGEPVDPSRYHVDELAGEGADTLVGGFVRRHHYSGSMPSAVRRFVMSEAGEVVGAVVFSVPMTPAVLGYSFPASAAAVELGRLVLLDRVPANGESWLVARCFDVLRRTGLDGVVSHADPERRHDAGGRLVMPGHVGTVYQALSARHTGRTSPRTLHVLPDGTVFSDRAATKVRRQERGHVYAEGILVSHGAEPMTAAERALSPAAWLAEALAAVARPVRHPGCFRYVWGLNGTTRRAVDAVTRRRLGGRVSLLYPKLGNLPTQTSLALAA